MTVSPHQSLTTPLPSDSTVALYDSDYLLWLEQTIKQLSDRQYDAVDWHNLCSELVAMGKRERSRLYSNLTIVLLHLLKWQFQPERRSGSWSGSIFEHRTRIARSLIDSPSLRNALPDAIAWAYPRARRQASRETGLPLETFPVDCPYTPESAIDDEFWPK